MVTGKVVCVPLCSEAGQVEAVLELVRMTGTTFSDEELETINSYLVWGGLVLGMADKV